MRLAVYLAISKLCALKIHGVTMKNRTGLKTTVAETNPMLILSIARTFHVHHGFNYFVLIITTRTPKITRTARPSPKLPLNFLLLASCTGATHNDKQRHVAAGTIGL